jgi:hypothetical protein
LSGLKTKNELSQTLNVTTKTIENYIKDEKDDIAYSKKLGKYHFRNLLPKKVTYSFVNSIIIDSVNNQLLQNDYRRIQKGFIKKYDDLIETKNFSEQLKNLIILNIAINHNITLSINYKLKVKKIIQPNQIFVIKDVFYVYVTYDEMNKEHVNQQRTLSCINISDISLVEYSQIATYKTNVSGNEYGAYSSNKYVLLTLREDAANFFKRNNVNYLKWDFINESNDTNFVYIKLFYNSTLEVKRLVQQWLPYISFTEETILSKEILNAISSDIKTIL